MPLEAVPDERFELLSARERDCLRLVLQNLSSKQIARMLGISQIHVAVLLHRTRKQLQNEIRSYMEGGVQSARGFSSAH